MRQHAKPNQEDNPNAHFIADEANHVEKETAATQTSHDRDDENPTPGGNHPGSEKAPGDAERTRIAESEEHKGEKNRAPGERGTDFDVQHEPKIPKPQAEPTPAAAPLRPSRSSRPGAEKNPTGARAEPRAAAAAAADAGRRDACVARCADGSRRHVELQPGPTRRRARARRRRRAQAPRIPRCLAASSGRCRASVRARRRAR